jgi:hypothetical protein
MSRYNKTGNNKHKKNRKLHKKTQKIFKGGNFNNKSYARSNKSKSQTGIKQMNCNPQVKGKTADSNTCFTNEALQKLKISYNKENPSNRINSTDSKQIWSDLKERMTKCKREDCWLQVIKDPNQREELDKQLFAPDMPDEWKKKPNTWLSNFDIMAVLEQYEKSHPHFKMIGPTPIDFDAKPPEKNGKCVWQDLCTFSLKHCLDKHKTKIGIIFNLDKHDQGGSHWISLFLDLEEKFLFFLDSAGESMPKEVKVLVDRIANEGKTLGMDIKVYENHPLEHQMGNTECGVYSLFFIITMLTNEADGKKLSSFQDKLHFFKDKRIPDKYIQKYRKIYFND